MSDEKNSEIKVSGFSLSIAGDSISRIAGYAADVIGMIGEPAGIVTDTLRAIRKRRDVAAQLTLARASELAGGVDFVTKKPTKLLLPIIEGSSREDIYGENISEIWARMLVNCPDEFDSIAAAAIDCLGRMGPRDAQALQEIANYTRLFDKFAHGDVSGIKIYREIELLLESLYRSLFSAQNNKNNDLLRVSENFVHFCRKNHRNLFISSAGYASNNKENSIVSESIKFNNDAMLVLNREGLIFINENSKKTVNINVWMETFRVSDFGIRFLDLMRIPEKGDFRS